MNKVNDFLYERETFLIRKACFEVWKQFGSAYKESVIDRALTIELHKLGLSVEDQKRIEIFYGGKKIGEYVPDKIINGIIILELKRKTFLTKQDQVNFWNYLRGSSYKLGLLINFGDEKLEIKRVVYDKARRRYQR
jgi:GxxExxY protein